MIIDYKTTIKNVHKYEVTGNCIQPIFLFSYIQWPTYIFVGMILFIYYVSVNEESF